MTIKKGCFIFFQKWSKINDLIDNIKVDMDVQIYSKMWQTTNLYNSYNIHPAIMQMKTNNNECDSWFHSRKPSMDDVGNPTSVNARWVHLIQLGMPLINLLKDLLFFPLSHYFIQFQIKFLLLLISFRNNYSSSNEKFHTLISLKVIKN